MSAGTVIDRRLFPWFGGRHICRHIVVAVRLCFLLLLSFVTSKTGAQPLTPATDETGAQLPAETLREALLNVPVQEKVYLHLDNTCYYKGDTIWYKAYVVRADDMTYTDMSRILYVELVSPDGYVVDRQNIILSDKGYSNGNIELKDSLYSGFYEIRAYTRWMMNFCVTEHPYRRKDREQFYNKQMARDFFRQYGTVYSRVFPVYERPSEPGSYAMKYIVGRPKTRLDSEPKKKLNVQFFPEGGHLVAGTENTVAFEVTNELGEYVDVSGTIGDIPFKTEHRGRGAVTLTPAKGALPDMTFEYEGKNWTFSLPKPEKNGCSIRLTVGDTVVNAGVRVSGIRSGEVFPQTYYVAVLCRGVLKYFHAVDVDQDGRAMLSIPTKELPTGVNDLLVLSESGALLADRLFFVNNHDYDSPSLVVSGSHGDYEAYAPISLQFESASDIGHVSISVRDASTDEPTYDTGNILTEFLLSSDLKGFIAGPDYYFESDDAVHQRALDLLMMVQGWRRYDYEELTSGKALRYTPEKNITVEGAVYNTVDFEPIMDSEISYWRRGIFGYNPDDPQINSDESLLGENIADEESITEPSASVAADALNNGEQAVSAEDPNYGIDHGSLKKEVIVVGELVLDKDVADVELETTNGGRFSFNVPPYYGDGILFLSAYKKGSSEKKVNKLRSKDWRNEDAWPEYYVKRDLFFPIFADKYSYYQCHFPKQTTGLSFPLLQTNRLQTAESLRWTRHSRT